MFEQMTTYFKELGEIGLALNSFVESFFLVPPPDFLLIAMDLAQPSKSLWFALICTIASALGGAVGYFIGKFGGRPVFNWMFARGKNKNHGESKGEALFKKVEKLYVEYGSICVLFAAFTPIPYKVFTIASGILNMNFWGFMLASIIGRGLRFFIVSLVLFFFGEWVKNYLELVIIAVSIVIAIFFFILYKKRHSLIKK